MAGEEKNDNRFKVIGINDRIDNRSELEVVSEKAIQKFISAVGDAHNIPKNCQPFFAYFYKPHIYNSSFETVYTFQPIKKMEEEDLREAIRIVVGKNASETDFIRTISCPLSNIEKEIEIPFHFFPEYSSIPKGSTFELRFRTHYLELMKLPPLARTFFSGVFYSIENYDGEKKKIYGKSDSEIILPVSIKQIIDYAASNDIKDVSKYLNMLKIENKS